MSKPILNSENVRALSLSRPWPMCYVDLPEGERKKIDNRHWSPPQSAIGKFVALHAAGSWDADRLGMIRKLGYEVPDEKDCPSGELFAVAKLIRVAESVKEVPQDQRRWWLGPRAWIFEDVVKLIEPVKCSGAQGLWAFGNKPDVLRLLIATYERSL